MNPTTLLRMAHSARAASLFPDSPWHGDTHWQGVADQALWLGELLHWPQRDRLYLFAFGVAHDCQRHNEGYDPHHGARAAQWVEDHQWCTQLGIAHLQDSLCTALIGHDGGTTTTDPLIGACWDADRSLLGRVDITPNPAYFSTATGPVFSAMVARGQYVQDHPQQWEDLARRACAP